MTLARQETNKHIFISQSAEIYTTRSVDEGREGKLRNLSQAVGKGLDEEFKRNKSSLSWSLSIDFNREVTLAETCVYHDDFDGALYHGIVANMLHRTLKELEV